MSFIVAFVHLYAYIHPNVKSAYFIPACALLTDACLGLFTFVSGYLLGKKYHFGDQGDGTIVSFYKKRVLRIIPLFLLAALALWLIGFNTGKATLNGVLCISPFVKVRPMTLWYIPVILTCYLITPVVSRKGLSWCLGSSIFIIAILLVLEKLVPSVDKRLAFNMFFFLTGIVTSRCFDWKMTFRKGTYLKIAVVLLFLLLLFVGQNFSNFHNLWFKRFAAGIGVFAILFFCEWVAALLFGNSFVKTEGGKSSNKNVLAHIVMFVSYASMAVYMFHRLFFWLGEKIFNPTDTTLKWSYMLLIVFPVMCVLSYYIQKTYDAVVSHYGSPSKYKTT